MTKGMLLLFGAIRDSVCDVFAFCFHVACTYLRLLSVVTPRAKRVPSLSRDVNTPLT